MNICFNSQHQKDIKDLGDQIKSFKVMINNKLTENELLLEQNKKLLSQNQDSLNLINSLKEQIDKEVEWNNPYNWSNYNGNYSVVTGIQFPANTCLSINDKNIKKIVQKLKGKDIEETALNIEKWCNEYIRYIYDHNNNFHKGFIEWWQQASMTFALKEGDCDDYMLLFQTMLHQLGYGKETIGCAGNCDFSAFKQGMVGHAYSRVLINGEFIVFDACNGATNRAKIIYPDRKDEWFFLNYWGVYKI